MLDKILIWDRMDASYNKVSSRIIPSVASNHKLVLFELGMAENFGPLPLRYNQLWSSHEEAKQEVENVWRKNISGSPTYIWESKLKAIKAKLKDWAKTSYKDPHREKETLNHELTKI